MCHGLPLRLVRFLPPAGREHEITTVRFPPPAGREHEIATCTSGPGCSKLTMSLVNVSLKFQTLISNICQYFLLKKCEKLLQCKSFSYFFPQKISACVVTES